MKIMNQYETMVAVAGSLKNHQSNSNSNSGNDDTKNATTGMNSQKHLQLTKIQSPATALRQALSQVEITPSSVASAFYQGIPVTKVTSGGSQQPRIVTLSSDHSAIFVTHQRLKTSGEAIVAHVASRLPIPLWTPRKGFAWTNSTTLKERYVRYLDIADIDQIVIGVKGTSVLEQVTIQDPSHLVIIYHHGMEESLNLIVEDKSHRETLVQTLQKLKQTYYEVIPWISSKALLLRYLWYHVDLDLSGNISRKEFCIICDVINLEIDAKKFFDKFPRSGSELTYQECMRLLRQIQESLHQTLVLWDDLFTEEGSITPKDFWVNFLQDTQEEASTTIEDAQRLLQSIQCLDGDAEFQSLSDFLPPPDKSVTITKSQWEEYLYSRFNSAYDPMQLSAPPETYFDEPISRYWINTSHNTYLTGDQLQSKSSVEAYTLCLYRGCKCLEIDCWDGSNNQAAVYHGHTLTTKIAFVDILQVVKAYIQSHPSTLPIILSLENHCSHAVQSTMAAQLREVFGDALYVPPLAELKKNGQLPSPNELRGKVVIKGKRPPDPDEESPAPGGQVDGDVAEGAGNNVDVVAGAGSGDGDEDEEDPYDDALDSHSPSNKDKKKPKPKIAPELAALTLFHGTKFKSFEKSLVSDSSHMHSIGETKISKLLKSAETPKLWRKYNDEHLTRTYPAGVRVDSSNYNPIVAWAMGCQLVALNFQSHDTPMILNDGRFRQHGGCGYVRKTPIDSSTPLGKPRTIQIQVISGHCLPKPKGEKVGEAIDPYVRVELHDVRTCSDGREEYVSDDCQTSVVKNNGFCPSWNSGEYKSFQVHNPDVAMFYFQVLDEDLGLDDKIASAAIPVNCLREGYRSISLCSGHGSHLPSGPFEYACLLVRIHFDEIDGA